MIIATTTTVKTAIITFLQRVQGYALVYDPHILLLCCLLLFRHKVIFYCIEIYCNKPIIVREREREDFIAALFLLYFLLRYKKVSIRSTKNVFTFLNFGVSCFLCTCTFCISSRSYEIQRGTLYCSENELYP